MYKLLSFFAVSISVEHANENVRVPQLVEHLPLDQEVMYLIPSWVKAETRKLIPTALALVSALGRRGNVTLVLLCLEYDNAVRQCYRRILVFFANTRHYHDMTGRLLKVM